MRRDNYYHGYNFGEFLRLAERAILTVQREPRPEGGGMQETRLFNYNSSNGMYWNSLMQVYSEIASDANFVIERMPSKIHRLNYLSGMLADIKGVELLISEDQNGLLKHAYFNYKDISEEEYRKDSTLGQEAVQDYLVTLKRYILMVRETIEGIKNNIESSPQSELPLSDKLQPKPYDSTPDIPEQFINYLVTQNGIAILRNQFIPTDEERAGFDHIEWDEETETKTYYEQDYESGDYTESKYSFSQSLLNVLYAQFNIFTKLADEKISTLKSDAEITFYIKLLTSRIEYVYEVFKNTPSVSKYEKVGGALKAALRYIYQKYKQFAPSPTEMVKDALAESKLFIDAPKTKVLPSPKSPPMFRWIKGVPERMNTILHERINGVFIEKMELTDFSKIFEGGYLDPSPAIRWIDISRNKAVNKVSLLYLFKKLAEAELIDMQYDRPEMIARLEYIFTDATGSRLTNWAQSKKNVSGTKSSTPSKLAIDEIVAILAKTD